MQDQRDRSQCELLWIDLREWPKVENVCIFFCRFPTPTIFNPYIRVLNITTTYKTNKWANVNYINYEQSNAIKIHLYVWGYFYFIAALMSYGKNDNFGRCNHCSVVTKTFIIIIKTFFWNILAFILVSYGVHKKAFNLIFLTE